MKIYTGFGDQGNTHLLGGSTVTKNHIRVQVYGTLDELNSIVGVIRSQSSAKIVESLLQQIQNEIFILSSELAADAKAEKVLKQTISIENYKQLEKQMDEWSAELPELKNFVLPGGSEVAAFCHLARTVCRRAEREMVEVKQQDKLRDECLIYINRLSDWFFVLARYLNYKLNVNDIIWTTER